MPLITRRSFDVPPSSEITPRVLWEARRRFLAQTGARLAAGAGALTIAAPSAAQTPTGPGKHPKLSASRSALPGAIATDKPTSYQDVTTYNNFYEFGTDKAEPARRAAGLRLRPWTVRVDGEVAKPRTFGIEDLLKLAPMEERLYRLRCVEGWSMVIPWTGWPLAALLKQVEPTSSARFVEFTTLADKAQMPALDEGVLDWPYVEALRIDEAMHPLTLMAFGLYGELLPRQNGAPMRLVVPWKYGFKSAKSIVHIRLVNKPPLSSWQRSAPREYGFYANVNPNVDHPRWSQASERRIGEGGLFARKRPTLMFNGYEPQVAQLYAGMDLKTNF